MFWVRTDYGIDEYSSVSYKGNQYYQSETKDLRVNREEDMKTTPNGSTGKTAERSQKSQRFGWVGVREKPGRRTRSPKEKVRG
jgi:hypothetical protein